MKLVVGLGNPGSKYHKTPHNLGFMVADSLLKRISSEDYLEKINKDPEYVLFQLSGFAIMKPLNFMNLSGEAVAAAMRKLRLVPSDVWVVHDDLDIPFGKFMIKVGGGSAGHHGMDSIIEKIGYDFVRFRLGLAGRGEEENVLRSFTQEEETTVQLVVERTSKAIMDALEVGIEKAMNKYNR